MCGGKGEEFCRKLGVKNINDDITFPDMETIIGIFVFCYDVDKHKLWTRNYRKIWDIIKSGFQEVFVKLSKLHDKYVTTMILGGNEDANDNVKSVAGWLRCYIVGNSKDTADYALDYYEKLDTVSTKFLAISHMCMGEESINPAKVAEEIGNIHLGAKTVYIDKLKASNNMLLAFVFVYGGDLIFKPFNDLYAKQKYQKVMHITASALIELRKERQNNPQSSFFTKPGTILYRGVCRTDVLEEYKEKQKGYWPCFSSTSIDENVAKGFAKPGGTIFELKLSSTNPHPHLKLPPNHTSDGTDHPLNWRRYPTEEEVLTFTYLAIKVVKIVNENPNDPYNRIYLEQDESENVLAFDGQKIREYLRPRIEKDVLPIVKPVVTKVVSLVLSAPLNLTEYMTTHMISVIESPDYLKRLGTKTLAGNVEKAIELAACDYFAEKEKQLTIKYLNHKDIFHIIFNQLKFPTLLKEAPGFAKLHEKICQLINNAPQGVKTSSPVAVPYMLFYQSGQDEQKFWQDRLTGIENVLLEMVKGQFC
jgi:hypothetical protein